MGRADRQAGRVWRWAGWVGAGAMVAGAIALVPFVSADNRCAASSGALGVGSCGASGVGTDVAALVFLAGAALVITTLAATALTGRRRSTEGIARDEGHR